MLMSILMQQLCISCQQALSITDSVRVLCFYYYYYATTTRILGIFSDFTTVQRERPGRYTDIHTFIL